MSDLLGHWTDFNAALVGATAALAGLVIVAASVNITEIVASRTLTARLGSGIASLVLALLVSALGLIPAITAPWYGAILVAATLVVAVFQTMTARLILTDPSPQARVRWGKSTVGFLPIVAYLVAGALVAIDVPAALYAAAAGTLIAIIGGIVVSWVALVEVLR